MQFNYDAVHFFMLPKILEYMRNMITHVANKNDDIL